MRPGTFGRSSQAGLGPAVELLLRESLLLLLLLLRCRRLHFQDLEVVPKVVPLHHLGHGGLGFRRFLRPESQGLALAAGIRY